MQAMRIESSGAVLVGSYTPAGSTAIVALHGASEGERSWYLYRHLHDVLPSAGIGVLTFDRRGDGESTGSPSRGRFTVQADDALAFVDALDVERVGLWGISQGGWVAPLAAGGRRGSPFSCCSRRRASRRRSRCDTRSPSRFAAPASAPTPSHVPSSSGREQRHGSATGGSTSSKLTSRRLRASRGGRSS